MTLRLTTLCFDANDPVRLARFWAGVLNWETHDEAGEVVLSPTDGTRFYIEFAPVPEPKEGKNRIHVDLSSTSSEAQNATVRRAIDLGGRRVDIGQGPDAEHVVLADPEDNEPPLQTTRKVTPGRRCDSSGSRCHPQPWNMRRSSAGGRR